MNYWLVRADWGVHGGGKQFDRFIENNIWENGYKTKYQDYVNEINIGDTLLLADKSNILYTAKCSNNDYNGITIQVEKWFLLDSPIKFPGIGAYAKTISKIKSEKSLVKILSALSSRTLTTASFKFSELMLHLDERESLYLDAIKIKEYFSIKEIELEHLKDKKEIYFIGENGDGKTVLLQAITLALKTKYSGQTLEYIESLSDEKELSLETKDDKDSSQYRANKNIKNIFAYGINRNKVHNKNYDKYGFSGLFDTSDSRKTTYLKDPISVLEEKDTLIEEFIQKLNDIILKDKLQIKKENNEIIFLENDFKIDFEKLSEGYKSSIIWLCDLVSRLIENQQESLNRVTKLDSFKAIVIIDEVDLYLHPKWKYDFIHNIRKVFKNIQFIMTTHSMISVLGASEDAVFYKVYKEGRTTKVSHPLQSIQNHMANTLSTSPLFGMDTARARNNSDKIDTSDDYLYSKIHQKIALKVKNKKAILEDDILEMIEKELKLFDEESSK